MNTTFSHDSHFCFSGIFSATDYRTGMSHFSTFWCSLTCNKSNNRFGTMFFDVIGSFSFHATTNFTNHDNTFRFWIIHK